MTRDLKERLVGASILVVFAVIFIPMFLSDVPVVDNQVTETTISKEPEMFSSRIVPLRPRMDDRNVETGVKSREIAVANAANLAPVPLEPQQAPTIVTSSTTVEKSEPESSTEDGAGPRSATWVVQLGSFDSEDNAESLNKKLRAHNYPAFVEPLVRDDSSSVIYRVRVGPEIHQSKAESLRKDIKEKLGVEGILVEYP